MAQKMLQEIELGCGERHRTLATPRASALRLEQQIAEPKVVVRTCPPAQGANPRKQFLIGERLDPVVVPAGVQTPHAFVTSAQPRQKPNPHLPAAPPTP